MSSKTEYLQKYVGETVKRKKLRKKPKVATVKPRIHIIDDDINIATNNQDSVPESEEEVGEEAPQIAEIVDENPKSMKMHSTKWRTIENVTESNQRKRLDSDSDLSPPRQQLDNETSNQYKQSQKRKSDSDLSPPRSSSKHNNLAKRVHNSDSIITTKSESNHRRRLDSDSDLSPPRPQLDRDHILKTQHKQLQESDSDLSPPRSKSKHTDRRKRALSIKNESNPRKRLDSDSDFSPPRHQQDADHISRNKFKQPQERKSDSDLSPPRSSSKHNGAKKRVLSKRNEHNRQKHLDSDNDLSPPRHKLGTDHASRKQYKRSQDRKSDSDLSPPRSNSKHRDPRILGGKNEKFRRKHRNSDSDLSSSRRQLHTDQISSNKKKQSKETCSDGDSSPPRSSSKHDGLSEKSRRKSKHKSVKLEKNSIEKSKRIADKQEKAIGVTEQTEEEKLDRNVDKPLDSNKHISGSEGSGNFSLDGKDAWVPELFKPFARYKDDPELDEYLKKQERSGDTMLAYIRSKQKKEPSNKNVPVYKGQPPPPNRFNIQPGYRWDGVDRSNGFEKRYFDLQAKKKSQADLAYKWSVENM